MTLLTVGQVAGATRCPPEHVAVHWPQVQAALAEFGIDRPLVEVGLAATIAVETAYTFWPCSEKWARGETMDAYFTRMYAPPAPVAARLGNRDAADAIAYRGRGDIQLTGRLNYTACGVALGLPLVEVPEKVLDPVVSARAAAWYCSAHGHRDASGHWQRIPALCDAQDWTAVREAVNGGTANLAEFKAIVDLLLTSLPDAPTP